jgi:hypothetical protein
MESVQVISLAWSSLLKIAALVGGVSGIVSWVINRFAKPLDSYTKELAKQLARHQNLEKLVEETQKLTNAAEGIKSELLQKNWDRQTRWTAKRDLYVRIVQALGDLVIGWAEADQRKTDLAIQNYRHAVHTAPLMVSDEAFKPLSEFTPRDSRFGSPDWEADLQYNIKSAEWALHQFQTAARADLGFEPMIWKPDFVRGDPPEDSHGPQTPAR